MWFVSNLSHSKDTLVCLFVCVHRCAHTCTLMEKLEWTLGVFFNYFPPYFLRQVLSRNLESVVVASLVLQQGPRSHLPLPPKAEVTDVYHRVWLSHRYWRSKLGAHCLPNKHFTHWASLQYWHYSCFLRFHIISNTLKSAYNETYTLLCKLHKNVQSFVMHKLLILPRRFLHCIFVEV